MLTDRNIFYNKVIECKTYACKWKIIKQGCQAEVNFEGAGVKKRTRSQQQLILIMTKDTFIFKKGIFILKKGLFCHFQNYWGRVNVPSASRLWRPYHKNTWNLVTRFFRHSVTMGDGVLPAPFHSKVFCQCALLFEEPFKCALFCTWKSIL